MKHFRTGWIEGLLGMPPNPPEGKEAAIEYNRGYKAGRNKRVRGKRKSVEQVRRG